MNDAQLIKQLAAPILVTVHLTVDDAVVIRDALVMYRSPISDNLATRDRLLDLMQEKIDRAAAEEDVWQEDD